MQFSISNRRNHSQSNNICLSNVGYYHVDEEDKFHLAEKDCFAKLKDRKDIQLPLDLNEGINQERVDKPYLPASISYMMQWISTTNPDLKKVDVIMNTNLIMVSIGNTLIDYWKKNWVLECFMLDGKVYVTALQSASSAEEEDRYIDRCIMKLMISILRHAGGEEVEEVKEDEEDKEDEEEKEEKEEEEEDDTEDEDEVNPIILEADPNISKPRYYGLRFEDVLTTNNEGYNYSVITLQIAGYNILTRAEIDCSFNDENVELKVGLDPRNGFEYCKFRKNKLGETWLQSYYGGIKKVVYGLRSYEGFINRFFTYFVDEIPDLCKRDWSDVELTSFVEDVFGWMIGETKEGFRTRVEYKGDDFIDLSQKEYPEDVLPPWLY